MRRASERTRILTFDGVVGEEGTLTVPGADFRGLRVRVRLTDHPLGRALTAHGVEREEVERVAQTQMAEPDRAARFLLSEGRLSGGGFARRALGRGGRRR